MKNPLTPRWQNEDPAIRLTAVASGKLSEDVLKEIVTKDAALEVRQAAVNLIENTEFLKERAPEDVLAATRWAELVGSDLTNLSILNNLQQPLLMAIAQHASKEEFRLKAVESLPEAALCELLQTDNLSRVHQHCASAIETESNLSSLQKLFIDKNKNVSRILKSKLQALKHARELEAAETEAVDSLLQSAKQLQNSEPGPDYSRRIEVLKDSLKQLATSQADLKEIRQVLSDCEAIFAALPDPAELLKQKMSVIADRCEALRQFCQDPNFKDLAQTLQNLLNDWPSEAAANSKSELTGDLSELVTAQRTWQDLIANGPKQTLETFDVTRSQLLWPDAYPKPPNLDERIEQIRASLVETTAQQAERDAKHAELESSLEKFQQQLTEGHIKASNRANTRVTQLLKTTKPTSEQKAKAQQLQNKLQDLKDWQGFATQPKRDELCDKMQLLATDQTISMPEKAKAIKELQEEWRKLGASDSRAAQKSWTRFKALGDEAYVPVAEHFAAQQVVREQHLTAREEICKTLENHEQETDWDNTQSDWKALASLLQSTSTKWRQHNNVPRRDKKAIEKRFEQANKPLKDRLNQVQKQHVEQKEALIQQLRTKLEDGSDINGLINLAKSAQKDWQSIGYVDRRKDQKLWKAFRAQCDAVFSKRDSEKQAENNAAKEVVESYRAVCKKFEQSLDHAFERKDISSFRKEIAAIDLPKAHRGLEREVKKLIKQAESELKNRAKQNEELMFREFQSRCVQMDNDSFDDEAVQDITLSKELQTALDNRAEKDLATQDQILIRLEILADLPSPETSQTARMQYQVERLNKELSLGQKETRSERQQVQDLLIQWYSTTNKNTDWQSRMQSIATKLGLAK